MTSLLPLEGLPVVIRIAQQDHHCFKCGALIKKGDKMTMRMYKGGGSSVISPTCLKCAVKHLTEFVPATSKTEKERRCRDGNTHGSSFRDD